MGSSRASVLALLAVPLLLAPGQAASAPAASQSLRWIVFSAHPDGSGAAQLFRVKTDGQGLAQITKGRLPATAAAFSPGGKRLAFVRLGSGIFRVNVDGSGLKRLTSGRRDSYPVWSPNGKRIAFIRPYRKNWRVHIMSAAGGQARRLPQAPPSGRPSWAADGKSLFVPAAGDLVKIDARTGRLVKFYGLNIDIVTGQSATLSPNASRVAFVGPRVSTGPPDCGEGPCPQFGLYLANVRRPHRSTRIANDTGPAGWSPDGVNLVYVAKGELVLRRAGSATGTTISSGPHIATGDAPPAWQPR
jgi:hypothetical protein